MVKSVKNTALIVVLGLSLAFISFPRFDCQDLGPLKYVTGHNPDGSRSIGDAVHYVNYVEYFRGQESIQETIVPFRYRPLVPLLASLIPADSPMTALNLVNLVALYISLLFLFSFLRLLGFSFHYAGLGGLLYTISFPMLYYATTGYVDSVAMAVIIAGTYLVYRERWLSLTLLLMVGAAVKEVVVLVVPIAFGYLLIRRKQWFIIPALLTVSFVAATIIIRKLVSTGDGYYWAPALTTFVGNLRFRALASMALTFGLPGFISLAAFRFRKEITATAGLANLVPLLFGMAFTLLLVMYSMLSAYADGRFVWPITFYTIPLALWVIRDGISLRQSRTATVSIEE